MPALAEPTASQPMLKALVLDVGAAAAREALKPVRELHKELDGLFGISSMDASGVAAGVRMVLSRLAPLICTSEEVDRG
ncbi:hypothetical protein [Mycolicibacter heraklionensis]|uniref:hypothetical protein n=1 Tax=Mycolicibacter heraklionensis TaxID=512402 RepID=UPI0007EC186B|nr:hypothetical protein [Mycolicibacter heraklionensis]OBG32394.1 hypothetical protein A5671_07630 [Mycolicibacter heraklionensis]